MDDSNDEMPRDGGVDPIIEAVDRRITTAMRQCIDSLIYSSSNL
jgi:hypothetical protein